MTGTYLPTAAAVAVPLQLLSTAAQQQQQQQLQLSRPAVTSGSTAVRTDTHIAASPRQPVRLYCAAPTSHRLAIPRIGPAVTRSSAIADKPRDASAQDAVTCLTP